jgi:hypothetical protein
MVADQTSSSAIGTLNEKPLHAALKDWYARPGDRREVSVAGYVIDIVRGHELIEIQTRNVSAIARKLTALAGEHRVRLVHPIALEKWIVKLAEDGSTIVGRRKSPKRGAIEDIFYELVYIPDLLADPSFSVEVVLTREDELRRFDAKRRGWRRKGWVIVERRLLEVVGARALRGTDDLKGFLPEDLVEPFGTADLARAIGRPRRLAQRMAYCLRNAGVITQAGKAGNAILYTRA